MKIDAILGIAILTSLVGWESAGWVFIFKGEINKAAWTFGLIFVITFLITILSITAEEMVEEEKKKGKK